MKKKRNCAAWFMAWNSTTLAMLPVEKSSTFMKLDATLFETKNRLYESIYLLMRWLERTSLYLLPGGSLRNMEPGKLSTCRPGQY
ncbi:hypothetical protein [Thermogymnomonas acidicola]|uniref:hypothetical protein n=1 Tax=Thermogymnomonas acidicola TaxID=399579 RepID=UPI0013969F4C|nr:hypothetical protein [Thermogymnomonas acidicola]